jgi:ethanolamine utilization microcompartment shell protein EutL
VSDDLAYELHAIARTSSASKWACGKIDAAGHLITSLQAQLAQRDAALKAADNVSDAFDQLEQLGCQQSAARLSFALAAYRKARGQDA